MELIFQAIVPNWHGKGLPLAWPRALRWRLVASLWLVDILALLSSARTFALLTPRERELLLQRLAIHRFAWLRRVVQLWKLAALLTAN